MDGAIKRAADRMRAVRHMVRVQRLQQKLGRSLSLRSEGSGAVGEPGSLAELAKRRERATVKVPSPLRLLGRERRVEGGTASSRDRLELVAAGVSPHIRSRPQTARQRLREYKRKEAERTRQLQEMERAAEARRRRARVAPIISRTGNRRGSVAVDATARALRPSTAGGRMAGPPSLSAPRRAARTPRGRVSGGGGGAALTSPYAVSQEPDSPKRGAAPATADAPGLRRLELVSAARHSSSCASLGSHYARDDDSGGAPHRVAADGHESPQAARAGPSEASAAHQDGKSPPPPPSLGQGTRGELRPQSGSRRGGSSTSQEAARSRRSQRQSRGGAPQVVTKELRDGDSVERWALGLPRLFMRDSRAVAIFGRPCGGRLTVTWATRAAPRKSRLHSPDGAAAPVTAAAQGEERRAAGEEHGARARLRRGPRRRPLRPHSASAVRSSSAAVRSRPSLRGAGTRLGGRRSPSALGPVHVRAVDDMVIQGSASASAGDHGAGPTGEGGRPRPSLLNLGSSLDATQEEGEERKSPEQPVHSRATPGSAVSRRSAALARELLDDLEDEEGDGRERNATGGGGMEHGRESSASVDADAARPASSGPGSSHRAGSAASDLDARSTVDGAKSLLAMLQDERAEGAPALEAPQDTAPEDATVEASPEGAQGGAPHDGAEPPVDEDVGDRPEEGEAQAGNGEVAAGKGEEGPQRAEERQAEPDDLFDLDDDDEADSDVEAFLQSQK